MADEWLNNFRQNVKNWLPFYWVHHCIIISIASFRAMICFPCTPLAFWYTFCCFDHLRCLCKPSNTETTKTWLQQNYTTEHKEKNIPIYLYNTDLIGGQTIKHILVKSCQFFRSISFLRKPPPNEVRWRDTHHVDPLEPFTRIRGGKSNEIFWTTFSNGSPRKIHLGRCTEPFARKSAMNGE